MQNTAWRATLRLQSTIFMQIRGHTITCTMEELTNTTCKWPIGNPQHDDFHFCGNEARVEKSSYCEFHTNMAYRTNHVSQRDKALLSKKAA